jgi:competence protein ComEC
MISRSLRFRAPLLYLMLPLMLGLCLGRCGLSLPPWLCLSLALPFLVLSLFCVRRAAWWTALLCPAMCLAGLAVFQLHLNRLPEWTHLPPREARLSIRCDRLFAPGSNRFSGIGTVVNAQAHLRDLIGQKLYFSVSLKAGQRPAIPSSEFLVLGLLQTVPADPQSMSFERFLADSGIGFRLSRAQLLHEELAPGRYRRFCAAALTRMDGILSLGIIHKRPELAGVLRAMLLGQQQDLNEEQKGIYRRTGTMHLFAISGLHITAIAVVFHGVLALLRLPLMPKVGLCLGLLWLYVDITGAAPSAVRAFIMVAVFELAYLMERPINPLSSLCSAAFLVMLFTPQVLFGASFAMSYGIVAVLLLMAGPLCEGLLEHKQPWAELPKVSLQSWQGIALGVWRTSVLALGAGFCASLVSAITGISYFALFTPGSILVNLLLIPLSTLVLMAGLCSLFAGFLWLVPLSSLFNHSAAMLLWFMERSAAFAAELPGMCFKRQFVQAWLGSASLCLLLILCLLGYAFQWRWRWGGYAWPVLFTTLAIALATQRP